VPFRSRLGSTSVESGSEAGESIVTSEDLTPVGVSDFRVERLQNLVSGVWPKRRASVAAEVSGRGLVGGGQNRRRRSDVEIGIQSGRLRLRDL